MAIERKVTLDKDEVERDLASLRASFRVTEQQVASFVSDVKAGKDELAKFVSVGIGPTKDGLAQVAVAFKGPTQVMQQMLATMRQLQAERLRENQSIAGSAEAQVQAALRGRIALADYIAAQRQAAQAAQQAAREREQAAQEAAAAEEANLQRVLARGRVILADHLAQQREIAAAQIAAPVQNRAFDIALTPMNQFISLMRGRPFAEVQRDMQAAQASLAPFASALLSDPVRAIRILTTDSRAAGAAMSFLKSELDFVIGSRFGAIAVGFLVFGTLAKLVRESVAALAEFDEKFARIRALSIGSADALRINAEAQNFLRDTALKTGIGLGELTDKYLDAASATGNAKVAQALFTNALTLSKATGADFRETLLQLNGVFNVFGGQLGTVTSDEDKLRIMSSELFTAFQKSAATGADFNQFLKFVGASASIAGISFTRLLGITGLLSDLMLKAGIGGRGFDQVLRTLSTEADKFSQAFRLGLSRAQITEAPLVALDLLRQKFQQGSISAVELQANVADIFPRNATRAVIDFVTANDALIKKYEDLAQQAIDLEQVTRTVFNNLTAEFGRLKAVAIETFIGSAGGAEALRDTMHQIVQAAALAGSAIVFMATGLNQGFAAAAGIVAVLSAMAIDAANLDASFSVSREAAKITLDQIARIGETGERSAARLAKIGLGATEAVKPWEDLKNVAVEAEQAMQKAAKARVLVGREGRAPTALQQLEVNLADNLTVSLEEQLKVRKDLVDAARQDFKVAVTLEDKERTKTALVTALNALEQTRLKAVRDANQDLILQSDQLTEGRRSDAIITKAAADEEIRSRRGILAALQGQQAELQRMIDLNQVDARQGRQLVDERQKQINAQLQAIHQVGEAARRSAEQREAAEHRVLQAAERLANLQTDRTAQISHEDRRSRDLLEDRALLEQRQADQRIDADVRVSKARESLDRALREQQQEHRKTLEQQALGQVELLLGFPEQANQALLAQLDLIRKAQETQNLSVQKRIGLLKEEFGILEKIRGKEESRLDLEILFGSQFSAIQEAERQALEQFLASDPARQSAAERKARLRFGRTATQQETLATAAEGVPGFNVALFAPIEVRQREVDELAKIGSRRIELEKLIKQDIAVQLAERQKIEQEHAARVAEAHEAINKSERDRARLAFEHARQIRASNEAIADAQAARIKNERTFAINLREAIREQQRAQQDAQRLQGTGLPGRPDLPKQVQEDAALLKKQQEIELDRATLAAQNAAREAAGLPPVGVQFPKTPSEVIETRPIYILPNGTLTNVPPINVVPQIQRQLDDFNAARERALEIQRKGGDIFELPHPGFQRQSVAPEGALQQFQAANNEVNLSAAKTALSLERATQEAASLNAELKGVNESLNSIVAKAGTRGARTLADIVENNLVDKVAREIAFPTG